MLLVMCYICFGKNNLLLNIFSLKLYVFNLICSLLAKIFHFIRNMKLFFLIKVFCFAFAFIKTGFLGYVWNVWLFLVFEIKKNWLIVWIIILVIIDLWLQKLVYICFRTQYQWIICSSIHWINHWLKWLFENIFSDL